MGLAPSSHLPNTHFQGSSAEAAAAAVAGWGLGKEPEKIRVVRIVKNWFHLILLLSVCTHKSDNATVQVADQENIYTIRHIHGRRGILEMCLIDVC